MATSTSRAANRRQVHVHGAEVSTDGDAVGMYAEAIALMLAIVALLAAAWVAATPSEGADLVRPSISTPGDYVIVTPDDTIQQPDVDGPQEVAVVPPSGGADGASTFGNPFGVDAAP